ncbi:hypothetical protein THAOC_16359 [Thalassiosira oceanica]|uniref:DDE Tnp4 domain-containing protein n=1 Tax=Thalassiosira oceanica TaxID=159749 RepID=K0SCB4_THAOC|nr:hypothetical protein THAOC_16359 [Thalassiosira oceanica]|eukprot:EJK63010.1 hypothetical protein THAOC_16359 [Thalassiosira oceanica]
MTTFSKVSPTPDFAKQLVDADDFDLSLAMVLIAAAQEESTKLAHLHSELLAVARREEQNRRAYKKKKARAVETSKESCSFPSWSELLDGISDRVFRRKYRMSKGQFQLLCQRIREKVGDEDFRPGKNQSNCLCGEIRLAIGLRLLAGGSYLDLIGRAYGVESPQSIYNYFHKVIEWINNTFDFPLVGLLQGLRRKDRRAIARLKEISSEFASDSDFCFTGCIGAMDGLAVRIGCPSQAEIADPTCFFCRKNFFALNVQAICDRKKRILWISPGHAGSTHDSTAWQDTKLFDLLEEMEAELEKAGFFLVGDSAYPLSAYLQVPYPDAKPVTAEDAFNFWLSNSRIHIECAFGEIIMRFGLFWRALRFPLAKCLDIVKAAALLHNFLVDCREDTADDESYFRNMTLSSVQAMPVVQDQEPNSEDSDQNDQAFPLVSDNNEPKPTGRPTKRRKLGEEAGKKLRDTLTANLVMNDKCRPKLNRMRYNALGHAYFVE